MAVRFFYIDESYNDNVFCLSALSIRHTHWKECLDMIRAHRKGLRDSHSIPMNKEIHARDLVAGRGSLGPKIITKWERSQIFLGLLQLVTKLPTVFLFNVCLPKKGLADVQLRAWERMTNRIERTMKAFEQLEVPRRRRVADAVKNAIADHGQFMREDDVSFLDSRLNLFYPRAFIIADEGREGEISAAMRKMRIHNYIPSKYGEWQPGVRAKNIVTERIIEDPTFQRSERSYFLQLADCLAFALLKKEVPATPNVKKYGIDKMFAVVKSACYPKASPRDPFNIVR